MELKALPGGWQHVSGAMYVITLSGAWKLLVPSLFLSSLQRNAIGFSFEPGKLGGTLGATLLGASAVIGGLLYGLVGVVGVVGPVWLLGTSGAMMIANSLKPVAFVKPLCAGCRLFPIITEHEAIHLSGVEGDDAVWATMRERHSYESLGLEGDPNICWFCPIPKRIQGH